jgi:cytochrome c-type biogenesis protein CcmE
MTDTKPVVPIKRRSHTRYIVAAVVCAVIVVWMLTVLQKNVVYLRPVSYAVAHRDSMGSRTFRMGGTVVPGTIERDSTGARFEVTEGGATVPVDFTGGPPELFRNCAPAVVEGHWAGKTFVASRLLIRHGSNYDPTKRVDASCKPTTS